MARIIPPDYHLPNQNGLHESERQTLEHLAEALPDTFTVFSNVLWARSHAYNTRFGEIDFCVVSPAGQLIVVEQKSGGLSVHNGQILKRYGVTEKNAGAQLLRSISALKEVWQRQHQGETVAIDYLLYLPDYTLRELSGLQLDASRIVHAGSTHSLAGTILQMSDDLPDNPGMVTLMHDFLTGVLELELDIGRLQTHQERLYRRHEDSLLAWVNRLHFSPYILRINGCAGSGKTQIGTGLLRQALAGGEDARYICFNRPLADYLASTFNAPEHIQTRDRFYDLFLTSQGITVEYTENNGNPFEHMETLVSKMPIPASWLSDLLIIDEGQDIPPRSFDVLKRFLRPGGRLVWLEDPEQNLYQHDTVTIDNAVEVHLDQCFRTPTATLKFLTTLFPVNRTIVPANPHYGEEPGFHSVTPEQLPEKLHARIQELVSKGISFADIAIVSLHGLRHSALQHVEALGDLRLSRFTGSYSPQGEQLWSEGDIMLDSIYRFKGSQRPFILLIDADFNAITKTEIRLFYCGMTRATIGVDIFVTPGFEQVLRESLTCR